MMRASAVSAAVGIALCFLIRLLPFEAEEAGPWLVFPVAGLSLVFAGLLLLLAGGVRLLKTMRNDKDEAAPGLLERGQHLALVGGASLLAGGGLILALGIVLLWLIKAFWAGWDNGDESAWDAVVPLLGIFLIVLGVAMVGVGGGLLKSRRSLAAPPTGGAR